MEVTIAELKVAIKDLPDNKEVRIFTETVSPDGLYNAEVNLPCISELNPNVVILDATCRS